MTHHHFNKNILAIALTGILIFAFFGLNSCKDEDDTIPMWQLQEISTKTTEIVEPSGLSLAFSSDNFYTVSDDSDRIYLIDSMGSILDILPYKGQDPEGITIRVSDSTIWICEEKSFEVVQLAMQGNELERWVLDYEVDADKGPEGICYNSTNKHFYILNESDPGLLLEWTPESGILKKTSLSFASDYSGICCSQDGVSLWMVSDQDHILFKTDLNGTLLERYLLGFPKAEGVAQPTNSNPADIFAISESEKILYHFEF